MSEKMFMIKADYDDELMKFGKRKTDTKEEIDAAVKVVARYIGLEEKSVKLEYTNQHGYTYRVTMKVKNIFHIGTYVDSPLRTYLNEVEYSD